MHYIVLASDYDGTLATHGRLDEPTVAALERCRASGRHVVLVTGREVEDLRRACPRLDLFTRVVAENGAVLLDPRTGRERVLAEAPPPRLVERLRALGVRPFSVGRAIVATREPYEAVVLEAIRDLGLEYEVIFNKGAVMVLPSGMNKGVGLTAALAEMGVSRHNVVAVGDAENDHAFLAMSECGVAVSNALDSLKERADLVTTRDHGSGVTELIDRVLDDDLASLDRVLVRQSIVLGVQANEARTPVRLWPQRASVLLAGESGGGKSHLTTALVEHLIAAEYQCCVIDPEGDYEESFDAVVLGTVSNAPTVAEVRALLASPTAQCVVNLTAVPVEDRPAFAAALLPEIGKLRGQFGRPHWVMVDEAHHLFPSGLVGAGRVLPAERAGLGLVTVRPETVAREVLEAAGLVIGMGADPMDAVTRFARATGDAVPAAPAGQAAVASEGRRALLWRRRPGPADGGQDPAPGAPVWFEPSPSSASHRRHLRKYAEGTLDPDLSFYFRGPHGALNLRAANLASFLELGRGVDDETWDYHLRRGDYERWFREAIRDDDLAGLVRGIAEDRSLDPIASRSRVESEVWRRYAVAGGRGGRGVRSAELRAEPGPA